MPEAVELIVSILAVWRLSHLLTREDGPFGLVLALRLRLGRTLHCPYCLTLWFAAPVAVWMAPGVVEGLLLWLAISGGGAMLEKLAEALGRSTEPQIIEVLPADRE